MAGEIFDMRFHWEQPALKQTTVLIIHLSTVAHIFKDNDAHHRLSKSLANIVSKAHNSSSRQVIITLIYRGSERKILRTHGDKAEIVSKAEPIALALFSVSNH